MESSQAQKFFKSQKFTIVIITIAAIFVGGVLCGLWPSFAAQYVTFIGGILGAAGLYLAGNVGNDFLATKSRASVQIAHIEKTGTVIAQADQEASHEKQEGD